MIEWIAKTDPETARWLAVALFAVKFLLVSLALFLAARTIQSLPYLHGIFQKTWGQLIARLLIIAAAGVLCFWLVDLRVLTALELLPKPETLLWADVVLSALALTQLSVAWPTMISWIRGPGTSDELETSDF